METNQDESQVLETETTGEATEQTAAETTEQEQVDIEALKAKAAKADEFEEKNKQLFERLKKAQAKPEPKSDKNLSNKDILYLAKADIHADDLDDVTEYAALKKVSVQEAHDFMKPILEVRGEQRRTAMATSTKSPRGTTNVSGDELLARAEKTGELPDTDEGMEALAAARFARRFRNKR